MPQTQQIMIFHKAIFSITFINVSNLQLLFHFFPNQRQTYHPSASTDQPPVEASREFAVRVDKVVVLGLQGVREGRPLRARTQTEAKFSEIHAANEYLERDEIWGKLTGFKSNTANNRHNENRIEKKDHVKALVPIEIKVV
jgi:hypothetical protein